MISRYDLGFRLVFHKGITILMFEQTFKNIDDILHKDASCSCAREDAGGGLIDERITD